MYLLECSSHQGSKRETHKKKNKLTQAKTIKLHLGAKKKTRPTPKKKLASNGTRVGAAPEQARSARKAVISFLEPPPPQYKTK